MHTRIFRVCSWPQNVRYDFPLLRIHHTRRPNLYNCYCYKILQPSHAARLCNRPKCEKWIMGFPCYESCRCPRDACLCLWEGRVGVFTLFGPPPCLGRNCGPECCENNAKRRIIIIEVIRRGAFGVVWWFPWGRPQRQKAFVGLAR